MFSHGLVEPRLSTTQSEKVANGIYSCIHFNKILQRARKRVLRCDIQHEKEVLRCDWGGVKFINLNDGIA